MSHKGRRARAKRSTRASRKVRHESRPAGPATAALAFDGAGGLLGFAPPAGADAAPWVDLAGIFSSRLGTSGGELLGVGGVDASLEADRDRGVRAAVPGVRSPGDPIAPWSDGPPERHIDPKTLAVIAATHAVEEVLYRSVEAADPECGRSRRSRPTTTPAAAGGRPTAGEGEADPAIEPDLEAALRGLEPYFDQTDFLVLEAIDQLLYHGRGRAALGLLERSLPPIADVAFEMVLDGHSLRDLAVDLLLDDHLARPGGRPGLLGAARAIADVSAAAVWERLKARRDDPHPSELDRRRYRRDRPGAEVQPSLERLALRFGQLLVDRWGWPGARAHLARAALLDLLWEQMLGVDDLAVAHPCADCARERAPTRDPGRGATLLRLEPRRLLSRADLRVARCGGPFATAALLQALPRWVEWLEELGLVDGAEARAAGRELCRVTRSLWPAVVETFEDPRLARDMSALVAASAN